jgi:hypothetical protein
MGQRIHESASVPQRRLGRRRAEVDVHLAVERRERDHPAVQPTGDGQGPHREGLEGKGLAGVRDGDGFPRRAAGPRIDIGAGEADLAGDGALLTGYRLRYDPADPDQGIFLLAADGTATRVERFIKLMPGAVSLITPALPAGTYTLEVRANVSGNGDIRSGQLKVPLTVS